MRIQFFLIVLVAFLGAATACKSGKKAQKTSDRSLESVVIHDDFYLALERTPCYGRCPTYKLSVKADGKVKYEGIRSVDHIGHFTKTLSQEQLKQLVNTLEKANFWDFEDKYDGEVTDLPSFITEFKHNGKKKKILNRYQAPEALSTMQQELENIIGLDDFEAVED